MSEGKQIKVSTDNSGDWLIICIILFWNFGDNKFDLYDAIISWLTR